MTRHVSVLLCFTVFLFSLSSVNAQESAQNDTGQVDVAAPIAASPCEDPLYLDLCKKDLSAMSANEASYFSQMRGRCIEYRQKVAEEEHQAVADSQEQVARDQKGQDIARAASTAVVVVVLAAIIAGVVGFVIVNNQVEEAKRAASAY